MRKWPVAAFLAAFTAAFLPSLAGADEVNTIQQLMVRLQSCWQPPSTARAEPMEITVLVSFKKSGEILGHPRVTFESPNATDQDRLGYRIAAMEALQRCTPIPFSEAMGSAIAGRPLRLRMGRKSGPPNEKSNRADAAILKYRSDFERLL